jgi:transaldolase
MKATQKLHNMGQSLWLDNITRGLLNSGTLARYIEQLSVTGLTSNPTIFDHAAPEVGYGGTCIAPGGDRSFTIDNRTHSYACIEAKKLTRWSAVPRGGTGAHRRSQLSKKFC